MSRIFVNTPRVHNYLFNIFFKSVISGKKEIKNMSGL